MTNKLHATGARSIFRNAKFVLGGALAIGMAVALSAPAFADTNSYICLQAATNRCLDNPANGDSVQIDSGYQWTEHSVGTVGNQVNFSGSAAHFNTKFAGDTVIQLQNSSGSNCIRVNSGAATTLTTGGCGVGAYLIEHGGYLVHFSDTQTYNGEYILETGSTAKGSSVIVELPADGTYTNWNY